MAADSDKRKPSVAANGGKAPATKAAADSGTYPVSSLATY
jgi:hypothetical protein